METIRDIIGEHPANHGIEKCECGYKDCKEPAIGVFEVEDGDDTCDAPVCEKHAKEFKLIKL